MRYLFLALVLVGCTGTPQNPAVPDTELACKQWIAAFQAGHDAGITCAQAKVIASAGNPSCAIKPKCKGE